MEQTSGWRAHMDMFKVEWALLGSSYSLTPINKSFYTLPQDIMEDLKVRLVDAPVVALHSGAVLPKGGENALEDSVDMKHETALKKSYEASSLAIRPSAVLSNFAHAIVIWADYLLQNLGMNP
ncbi:UNVERIFIED_CONTAM: hypothetical protein K2H54_029540 [Gekko kuhli]